MSLTVKACIVSQAVTNCYLAVNGEEMFVVDPGDAAGLLKREIDRLGARMKGILLTHGHFDHIQAARALADAYHVPIYASRAEEGLLANPAANLTQMWGHPYTLKADELLDDGQEISLAGERIRCILTPGHTPGGMCFYLPDEAVLFSGDTLFRMSVGRTDFPGGSMMVLQRSLQKLFEEVPGDVTVYPGHDSPTTMAFELRNNPYVGDRDHFSGYGF